MSDQFTEYSEQSYGSRLFNSLGATLIGLALVPAGICLHYWNETQVIGLTRDLKAASRVIVEVDPSNVNPLASGKLVHLTGPIRAAVGAHDNIFGNVAPGMVRLVRDAEMYQWQERQATQNEDSIGGVRRTRTTYSYQRVWSSKAIDSGAFKQQDGHLNPPMRIHPRMFDGSSVTVGAYAADDSVLQKLTAMISIQPQSSPPLNFKRSADGFMRADDTVSPSVGDVRVRFRGAPSETVSVVAAQAGRTLTEYKGPNGFSVASVEPGEVAASTLLSDHQRAAGHLAWILRGGGILVLTIGFLCVAEPVITLFAILPLLESLVAVGAFLLSFTLGIQVSLMTIAVVWMAAFPMIGAALMTVAVGLMAILVLSLRSRRHRIRTIQAAAETKGR